MVLSVNIEHIRFDFSYFSIETKVHIVTYSQGFCTNLSPLLSLLYLVSTSFPTILFTNTIIINRIFYCWANEHEKKLKSIVVTMFFVCWSLVCKYFYFVCLQFSKWLENVGIRFMLKMEIVNSLVFIQIIIGRYFFFRLNVHWASIKNI